jgi:hypothetical protein
LILCFHLLSSYSTEVYNFYFNEYEPFSTIVEAPNQKTELGNLKHLADSAKADYIVSFTNIHTEEKEGFLILKLTTLLYSKRDNKILLRIETEGDTHSRGEMWTCDMSVTLSCLLVNGVRTSTDEVANVLRRRQIRQK